MRRLIVNADDFGYSFSINRGIVEAHTKGVVTATSVMVDAIAAHEATGLAQFPDLSVGLHLALKYCVSVESELQRQVQKFVSIVGVMPDHLNTHKIAVTDPRVRGVLLQFSADHKIPLRALGSVTFIDSFFGDDVSVEQFKLAVDQATADHNEIMCHVGYSDDYLRENSSYSDIREAELRTVCSEEVRRYVQDKELSLCNWKNVSS